MLQAFDYPEFAYQPCEDMRADTPVHHPIVIVGAGPVGMAAAMDFASRGRRVLVLDDDKTVSVGSRAICFAKRTLEIMDRLGVGDALLKKGIVWKIGKVFFGQDQVYQFDLLPEDGHRMPAFVNLQQYHFEKAETDWLQSHPLVEMRWQSRVTNVTDTARDVLIDIETPDGPYRIRADWVLAADGARSAIRKMLDLDFHGQVFKDRFLIADVVMKADFPSERWFWFDPPFNPGQSALLHMQADNVWRIDLQLGWDADPEEEKKPERVIPRLKRMLGEDVAFELEWVSVYTFQCRRLDRFRHGRVLFVGDAAHQVSPFGARGANSGIQDVDNLVWKLDLVMQGKADESLLDSYDLERVAAADENILNSTRSTDFITPKSPISRLFRDAALELARDHAFARRIVNSGRLSVPSHLTTSPLNTPDDPADAFAGTMAPGAPCADAPIRLPDSREGWLMQALGGDFTLLVFGAKLPDGALGGLPVPLRVVTISDDLPGALADPSGAATARYDARPGTLYLIRPDQHVAARSRGFDRDWLDAALSRALGRQN